MNTKNPINPTVVKTLRISIIVTLCALLCTPFIAPLSLFFPYITGKAFFMRACILLAAVLYAMLATVDKAYRPRKSILMYSVLGFMIVLIASCIHSVNPTRSFWSNFERMEGLVTLLYMGALFIISAATIKKREWTWLMNSSLAISVIVGINAFGDFAKTAPGVAARISGKLGNSSYLGVYALIHIFIAILGLLMVFRGKREEELLTSGQTHAPARRLDGLAYTWMAVYAALALFNTFVFYSTGTRGSFIGFVGGLLLTAGYLAWKERNKVIRYSAMGVLSATVVAVAFLGFFKHSSFIENRPTLTRFAAMVTLDVRGVLEKEGAARAALWNTAFDGVKERPLLGWGQDTFGYVFAKYYDPAMYQQEQWFDRSHNVFLDWLISAGVLGLIGYLMLFIAALICIFSPKSRMSVVEKAVLLGLLAAYFAHNLFVFDNLTSYVLFFILLAYMHDRYTHDRGEVAENGSKKDIDAGTLMIAAGFLAILIASYVGYKTIYQPYAQNKELIGALRYANAQNEVTVEMLPRLRQVPMDLVLDNFVKAFDLGHTGEGEAYEQLMTITSSALGQQTVSDETKIKMVELFQKRVMYHEEHNPGDPRYPYFASTFYSRVNVDDQAMVYAQKAYDLSPNKQSFAYLLATLTFKRGDVVGARDILKKAYESEPRNADAFAYYVSGSIEEARNKTKTGFDAVKIGGVAEILADGYKSHGQTLPLEKRFWDVIKAANGNLAKTLSNRLAELIPEKKAEIQAFVK